MVLDNIILCMSHFNHVPSGDTLRRDAISSLDTDTALKVSHSVYCFTTSVSHGVENYILRLWGTGISDAIFVQICSTALNRFFL